MNTVRGLLGAMGAFILDHPRLSAGVLVATLAAWTIGGLIVHLRSEDRRERRWRRRNGH